MIGQQGYSSMSEDELKQTIELAPRVSGSLSGPLLTCAEMMANSNAQNAQRELSKRKQNRRET